MYTESCFQTVMHQAVYNSSVSMATIAVAKTQPFSILSFKWPLQHISGSLLHQGIKVKQEKSVAAVLTETFHTLG